MPDGEAVLGVWLASCASLPETLCQAMLPLP